MAETVMAPVVETVEEDCSSILPVTEEQVPSNFSTGFDPVCLVSQITTAIASPVKALGKRAYVRAFVKGDTSSGVVENVPGNMVLLDSCLIVTIT